MFKIRILKNKDGNVHRFALRGENLERERETEREREIERERKKREREG